MNDPAFEQLAQLVEDSIWDPSPMSDEELEIGRKFMAAHGITIRRNPEVEES